MATSHVLESGAAQQVWWMPVHQHAFDEKQGSVAFSHRVAMCAHATAPFGDAVEICTIESEFPERNRTLDTLDILESRHPDTRFRLMIGADVFAESHLWKGFDELAQRAPFIVLGRPGHAVPSPWSACTELPDVQSRRIRDRIARGESAGEEVPPAVTSYIESHQLYRDAGHP
jgi:nicotinate-nucleotide adenylyltransferase